MRAGAAISSCIPIRTRTNARRSSVAPVFNRCVIFGTSEKSWHAFDRIRLPAEKSGASRKSIALYFYSRERPQDEIAGKHTTHYVNRADSGTHPRRSYVDAARCRAAQRNHHWPRPAPSAHVRGKRRAAPGAGSRTDRRDPVRTAAHVRAIAPMTDTASRERAASFRLFAGLCIALSVSVLVPILLAGRPCNDDLARSRARLLRLDRQRPLSVERAHARTANWAHRARATSRQFRNSSP